MFNDFVEIDESSLPSLTTKQPEWDQIDGKNYGEQDDNLIQPCLLVDSPPKGKNSIFEMDHRVLKPVTKMTPREIEDLKAGIAPINLLKKRSSNASIESREIKSIFIPIPSENYGTNANTNAKTPAPKSPTPRFAFLQRESSTKLPDLLGDIKMPLGKRNVYVNYLPIKKNLLGYGQFCQVFRGTFTTNLTPTESVCAVKKLNLSPDAQSVALVEIKMLSLIVHPSVITMIDAWDENGMPKESILNLADSVYAGEPNLSLQTQFCIALEYCANGNMWDWSQLYCDDLSSKLCLKWIKQMLSAMKEIHAMGIIHHDIKPHNVLVF